MNKAITDGLVLMPPPFSAGLNRWSREDGTPGSGSYAGQPNAAYVPNDQDFAGCLELQKVDGVQKLRCFQEIPFQPGLYLRVTARVKAVAGNLPEVRIAAWAGRANDTAVTGIALTGPAVALESYGAVVTVSAIIGSGNRAGVDMVWGTAPAYAHLGLDLTGANGGVVRIDDIVVEDVTEVFHRKMMDWVDVRDYGALGDGATDDTAAFAAADSAAQGRSVLVSAGTYRLAGNITFENAVRFEGTVTMPAGVRLICRRNFDLDTYAAAFGSELAGFRKALQALFYFSDHVALDLSGRRIDVTEPIDVADVAGLTSFEQRRVLSHGQLIAAAGTTWADEVVNSVATYSAAQPTRLTAVANVANVPVGALVTGTGVGREVYVTARNVGAGTVTLSQPLWGAAGTRNFTFRRFKYMLDFSGFSKLSKFEIADMELQCNGNASGILLAPGGNLFRISDTVINRPRDRGITSHGEGCQGMFVDQCQFLSNEQSLAVQDRTTIALNVNANDVKLRHNVAARFAHFAVMAGTTHMILGNHFYLGDDETAGIRRAGIVLTAINASTVISGNYIDNCFIEWANEHDAAPEFDTELSFGGLNIVGNICYCSNVAPSFRWIVLKPYGPGHFIHGLTVTNNSFRAVNGNVDRVEKLDTTHANLDFTRFRNITFESNSFNAVSQLTASPLMIQHTQNTASDTWVIDAGDYLPFNARARNVQALVAEGAITNGANVPQHTMPFVRVEQGAGGRFAHLQWPVAVKGVMHVTLRGDNPL